MRSVVLTAGPRAAGKTTVCRKIVEMKPEVGLVERDEFLRGVWNTAGVAIEECRRAAYQKMFERVKQFLAEGPDIFFLDMWNGFACERRSITRTLRKLGADRIDLWLFVTPEDICVAQYLKRMNCLLGHNLPKQTIAEQLARATCRRDYIHFHRQPITQDQGFDEIRRIDPTSVSIRSLAASLRTAS